MVVFGGELWPVANGVTFVELPLSEAIEAYREWGSHWASAPSLSEIEDRPIIRLLQSLLPLQEPYKKRLLVETRSSWTAVFDNSRSGDDTFPPTYLATENGRRAVEARHTPPSQHQFPATQFHLFGATGEPPLQYVRTIDAGIFDSGRWSFQTSGVVQPFEQTEAYTRRKIRDRFTRDMLLAYLAALGIMADQPTFYGRGVLAEGTDKWSPAWTGTLDEARAEALEGLVS